MIGRKVWGRVAVLVLAMALMGSVLALTGCGGTLESPGGPKMVEEEGKVIEAAVKAEILKAMDSAGLKYVKDYVAMEAHGDDAVVVTAGTIVDTKNGNKELAEVTVAKGKDGKWVVKTEK